MADFTDQIINSLQAEQSAVGLAILFFSALFEYLFPPFPGDTVTLFGAFLSANQGWSVPLVFLAVTLGSLFGALIDYSIGWRLGLTPSNKLTGRTLKVRRRIEPILAQFRRYGLIYISINRFLPGIRALFFVAAGMARLPLKKVLLWGTVSAVAWNTLIIAAGFILGKNWERMLDLLRNYTLIAWIAAVAILALAILKAIRR